MTTEPPIEMLHLPQSLRKLFAEELPETGRGSQEDKDRNLLSRALAAYAIHKLGGASIKEATESIVDGGGDGGIDGLFHAVNTNVLWVVQSKFIAKGRGEPSLSDVTKFKTGLENLLQGHFDAFHENAKWKTLIPRLRGIFDGGGLEVRAVLIYSGINLISEDRRRLFENLKQRFSPGSDAYFDTRICNLTTIHDWLTEADKGPGVPEVELTLLKPGWVKSPYETVYGLLPLSDLAHLYARYGRRLIAANIRAYKGNTAVNDEITKTVQEEPEHFFYLNNGLTAYCERLEVSNLDRANTEQKRIKGYRLSIINGAQTLCSVAEGVSPEPAQAHKGFVFLKIISLERCEDGQKFADRITRSTNFQNQIGLKDFVALDDQQKTISNQLALSGISYHYKSDVEAPSPNEANFNLEEATSACACLLQLTDCDFYARVLANRQSLWSMEEIYPPEDLLRSRYSRIFRPERSARTIWRAVQTQRLVVKTMQDNGRASTGIRKAFFENARWLVLNVIFLKLCPEQGESLRLTETEAANVIQRTVEYAELLLEICETTGFVSRQVNRASGMEPYEQTRHFRSIFCAAGDCQILRNALLTRLMQAETHSGIL